MPTYQIKICYQFSTDRYYKNFGEPRIISKIVEVEISLNDVLCETDSHELDTSTKPIRVCTLNDILAEKLRALLQQVPRNRSRPQDVFDIASMARRYGSSIDLNKVSLFLVQKSEARGIAATKKAFNALVRSKAIVGYVEQIRPSTAEFIPFDEAWEEVLRFVSKLSVPE